MKNPILAARIALVSAVFMGILGCSHPPEAGSLDPHGPYTAEQARAAGMAAIKARGSLGRRPGNQAPPAAPTTAPSGN
jgi:20S proteasome alpha/beta subunit